MSLDARWSAYLDSLHREGRYRHLAPPTGIDLSSNDYLGYARLTWPATNGSRSGAASRLLRGHAPIWDEVETRLAHWHGAEAALVLNSGYVANEGLLATLLEPRDFVASDQCNHASLVDGLRLSKAERFVYRHNDLDHLESGLRTAARGRLPQRQLFIVTESLFGMEGDRAPLAAIADLARRYEAHLIVDEAHATGCFGPAGSGLVDALGLRPHVLATVHTGGKALGVPGAYVVGTGLLKELLVNRCRHLIFTTALPPALGSWWLDAVGLAATDAGARAALHEAARQFRQLLLGHGLVAGGRDYIVPLILGDDADAVEAARQLQAAGFDIRAIRPPTVPTGTARLRLSIHADHSAEVLDRVADALGHTLRKSHVA